MPPPSNRLDWRQDIDLVQTDQSLYFSLKRIQAKGCHQALDNFELGQIMSLQVANLLLAGG
ncbi:hypothetical protein [Pseudomonas sp. 24 E 13]|nr:hypothetical protein [Pseudomonas sp. 24 E 13]